MYWKLKVSEYGKIKTAEIEMAPLTLFVGDNNSGKSYLMSLLWGIHNMGISELLHGTLEQETEETYVLKNWFKECILTAWNQGICTVSLNEIQTELQCLLKRGLEQNKENIVKRIFNSSDIRIEGLEIELKDLKDVFVDFKRLKDNTGNRTDEIYVGNHTTRYGYNIFFSEKRIKELDESLDAFMVYIILGLAMGLDAVDMNRDDNIYLPSARTGFMLTKDIINKVGRNTAFNIQMPKDEISPFTRPINQFLDVINDLMLDGKGDERFQEVVKYLEAHMTEGTLEMSDLPNKEVMYIPAGNKKGMPLRVVSAVVTELSPLILLLKHKKNMESMFYEEPEICLHPQLQQKMARVICRLINAQLQMIITTHSDIILQHINNMIRLTNKENIKELCQHYEYVLEDLLQMEQVKVYQLRVGINGKTEVEELECGKNGFAVPTFNDALDRIMDEGYTIQE